MLMVACGYVKYEKIKMPRYNRNVKAEPKTC